MDPLAPLLKHFSLSANVFYAGTLCATAEFPAQPGSGFLHVLQRGQLRVLSDSAAPIEITEPSILLYRRPCAHHFLPQETEGATLVCAAIDFGGAVGNPLLAVLPEVFLAPMSKLSGMANALALLFEEAFAEHPGRQAAVDRLAEYCFLLLLRYVISHDPNPRGVLAALADARLSKAIAVIHAQPERAWTLVELADIAAMSRARFALRFRTLVGLTPLDYLADWRVRVACTLLKKGQPLKIVAPMVGYGSSSALSKAFAKKMGVSPTVCVDRSTP